ncbi:MAG: DUF5661 family protein [Nitrososphaeraceae archaeon]
MTTKRFTKEDAKRIGESLGIDWTRFDIEQFRMGLDVELEHGSHDLPMCPMTMKRSPARLPLHI